MGDSILAVVSDPATWPAVACVSAVTLAAHVGLQRFADWCEAAALGITTDEWRDLNRARLRAILLARSGSSESPDLIEQGAQKVLAERVHDPAPDVVAACVVESTFQVHDQWDPGAVASPRPVEARSTPVSVAAGRLAPEAASDVVSSAARRESTTAGRVFMGAKDQIAEFLEEQAWRHVARSKRELRRSCDDWWAEFQDWARRRAVVALPEKSFFGMLGKADHVKKSRPRLRDPATGCVAHNANGSPTRCIFYTFAPPVRHARTVKVQMQTQVWGTDAGESLVA